IADDWAADNVRNFFRDQIKSQLSQQYPDLPEANLEKITDEQFIKFSKENKKIIDEQIALNAEQYKDFFQYESGAHSYPYMGDIDSYYWLRQAKNIVEKGYNCDIIENGVCYDTYTVAPGKIKLSKNMHPYSIAFFYKLIKPFNLDITLMQVQIIVPTIFAVITAILVYLTMLKSFGTLAAITSSVLISVNPLFLSRSLGSDSDVYNIVFPVLMIFLAFSCFNARGWKAKSILSAVLGLSIVAYSFAWVGWWYLFDFILIAVLLDYAVFVAKEWNKSKKLAVMDIIRSEKTREMLAVLLPFFLISVILVGMISGFSALKVTYSGFLSFTKTKIAANPNLWPNVLTTVAEFNEASVSQVMENTWGKRFFFFALLGFIIMIYKTLKNMIKNWIIMLLSMGVLYYLVTSKGIGLEPLAYIMIFSIPFVLGMYFSLKSEESIDIRFSVLFFLWSAASIYAATKGIRFILLIIPPVAIGIGITFGFLHKTMTNLLANSTKINKALISIILFLALSYYLVEPVEAGISTSKNYLPNVNDRWWNALTKIRENSKPDAIINSWWDFGHWFKYIADRRVTLDGASQNHPQLHWLGKLLLTPDEKEAVGILRMLDCGGNKAFNPISNIDNDTPKSIKILNKVILVENRAQAKDILAKEGLSEEQSEKVLEYTYCEPPENFLITSEDMIGKSGVWAHFGSWDFDRSWMYRTFKSNDEAKAIKMFMEEFNYSRETAASYYSEIKELKSDSEVNAWIAPWPSYISQESCESVS
ncbi:MAG: STT3 domain-containing protein, partial [Nanoarchaeota archaeon]